MKSTTSGRPGSPPVCHSRIDPPMTPTSRLLEQYAFAKRNAYIHRPDQERPNYSVLNEYISLHLVAAGYANHIATRIRCSRRTFYRDLAYKHCEVVTPSLAQLNEAAKRLCLDEKLNAALLAAQSHRELALSVNGSDHASHSERVRHILDRTRDHVQHAEDPAIPLRHRWDQLFYQLLRDEGPDDTIEEQVTALMNDAYTIVRSLETRRPEKTKTIRRFCMFYAERFGVTPDLRWRSPVKPAR